MAEWMLQRPSTGQYMEGNEQELPIPSWIKSEEVSYHLTPLVIKEANK